MRTEVFKTREEFEEWEYYSSLCDIHDYTEDESLGEFICDVLFDDYSFLVKAGLISDDGVNYLLKPLTDKQKEKFKENYGIRIVILEEDFALSDDQKAAIDNFRKAWEDMKKAKVGVVYDFSMDYIGFVNVAPIKELSTSYHNGKNSDFVSIDDAMIPAEVEFDAYMIQEDSLLAKF